VSLRNLAAGAGAILDRAVNEDVIRLAVTGLSRAGKTVFITSLVQNLLALASQKNVLPQLTRRTSDRGTNRLRDVTILPAGVSAMPYFDQAAKLAGLSAAEPSWPERTTDIAQISLALTLTRRSAVGQKLGERRVRLDRHPGLSWRVAARSAAVEPDLRAMVGADPGVAAPEPPPRGQRILPGLRCQPAAR
jgi:predicted YcjX-like family ATPase